MRDQSGERNPMWAGDDAGYSALHLRVESARGKPSQCEECGTTTAKRFEWANMTGRYEDVSDYRRLCSSCHHRHDGHAKNLGAYSERGAIIPDRIKRSPPVGEKNPRAKLTQEQANEIRLARGKIKQRDLARQYGVSKGTIWYIQTNQHWSPRDFG